LIGFVALLRWNAGGVAGVAVAEVREGPFRVSLIESGTLQALRSVTYASTIQSNQAKIVALAPEGKLVQKGDLLILFDSAPFEEEIRRGQAALAQAEADLVKARQDFNLQGIQNEEELQAARHKRERSDLELRDTEEGKGKLMGFGHRIYKNYDPRAKIIKRMADEVFGETGRNPKLDIALELERIALEDDYFVKRKLYPNVDFYSGLIYQAMKFPVDMFPVLFAIPRMSGWLAQWEEMLTDPEQKIARPRQMYLGYDTRDVKR